MGCASCGRCGVHILLQHPLRSKVTLPTFASLRLVGRLRAQTFLSPTLPLSGGVHASHQKASTGPLEITEGFKLLEMDSVIDAWMDHLSLPQTLSGVSGRNTNWMMDT
jgi:hypothetical protein